MALTIGLLVAGSCGGGSGGSAILPSIAEHPQSTTVRVGEAATFRVAVVDSVRGAPLDVAFQWFRNGVEIPAATNAAFTTPAVVASNSGEVFRAVVSNSAGTVSSDAAVLTVVDPGFAKASNTDAFDTFGGSVALSADGNTMAVGAPAEDSNATGVGGDQLNNAASDSGAVYLFVRNGGEWTQQAYLKASNAGSGDLFGLVALSGDGNTLAVAAKGEDSSATGANGDQLNDLAIDSGAVYVFTRSGTAWTQQVYLKASNTSPGDEFGQSLAVSADGDTIVVGSPLEDSNATGIGGDQLNDLAADSGAVYVFARNGATWSQQSYVKASNTGSGDRFGWSVALSADGDDLAVGAPLEDSNTTGLGGVQGNDLAPDSGAVYVFARTVVTWSQQVYAKASNTGTGSWFGWHLAVSSLGDTLAVGSPLEDSGASGVGGNETNNLAPDSGSVYLLARSGATWSQQAYLKASNTGASDWFGWWVSLASDGSKLAVGAPLEDSSASGIGGDQLNNQSTDSGAVFVLLRSGGVWSQEVYAKASNTGAGDVFGSAVVLSADGDTLAIGAYLEDSLTVGIGGDQANNQSSDSGAVYVR